MSRPRLPRAEKLRRRALAHKLETAERRRLGLCVDCKADVATLADGTRSVQCQGCLDRQSARRRARTGDARGPQRASNRRWHARKTAEGLCTNCGQEPREFRWKFEETRCRECRLRLAKTQREAYRARTGAVPTKRCGGCREPGHYRLTCPSLDEGGAIAVDEYAAARRSV